MEELTINIPEKDLKKLYKHALSIRNIKVHYDEDQLNMANKTIFQMQVENENIINYLQCKLGLNNEF